MSSDAIRKLAAQLKTAGGADYSVFKKGTNVTKLYNEAVEDARHEYGHGGYTGTIAESSWLQTHRTPMTMDEANNYLHQWMDRSEKGETLAIPIVESKVLGRVKDVTLTVKAKDREEAEEKAKAKARTLVTVRSGAKFIVKITSWPKRVRSGAPPQMEKQTASTRGVIITAGGDDLAPSARVVHANKPKANAALKEFLTNPDNYRHTKKFTMWKVEALETIEVKAGSGGQSTWEVGVQYKQVKPGNVYGYLFGGVYSS